MSLVNITDIKILDNPTAFQNPYHFEVTFECLQELEDDLEFKLIYVGSADNSLLDQELESVLVGPVPVGVNKFALTADPPKPESLQPEDILGVTVIILACSYKNEEFVRVGYYVNNEYTEEELRENPPETVAFDKVQRNVLAEKPRVTRFNIKWDTPAGEEGGEVGESATDGNSGAMTEGTSAAGEQDAAMEDVSVAAVGPSSVLAGSN
ncbi:Histone chaperone asf1 [Tieghemiomyces parasiticus]|uniref:Anti-silencing function protein 1 n=1 Tax=Tieghemiomyces parasiticus TaxID=78921 RepID=A0A9W8DWI0_9FUNG|nr:Histone chaperone asf1 [Tieghemiomyces parasiticus]